MPGKVEIMRTIVTTVYAGSIVFAAACASGGGGSSTTAPRGVLTQEMLMETQEADLYTAVQRLRPQWLRARGAARISGGNLTVTVFVNDVRRGEVDFLHSIQVPEVERVQFMSGSEATTRWGTGVAGGVILVTLRTG